MFHEPHNRRETGLAPIKVTKIVYEEIDSTQFKRTRLASGLSAASLCRKAQVHEQFVSRLERGLIQELPTETLDALLEAMAGEGMFTGADTGAVLAFMREQASFELRLVGDDEAALTTEGDAPIGYSAQTADDQEVRDLAA